MTYRLGDAYDEALRTCLCETMERVYRDRLDMFFPVYKGAIEKVLSNIAQDVLKHLDRSYESSGFTSKVLKLWFVYPFAEPGPFSSERDATSPLAPLIQKIAMERLGIQLSYEKFSPYSTCYPDDRPNPFGDFLFNVSHPYSLAYSWKESPKLRTVASSVDDASETDNLSPIEAFKAEAPNILQCALWQDSISQMIITGLPHSKNAYW